MLKSEVDFFDNISEEQLIENPIPTILQIDEKLTSLYSSSKNASTFSSLNFSLNFFKTSSKVHKEYFLYKIKFKNERKEEIFLNHLNLINLLRKDIIIFYNPNKKKEKIIGKGVKNFFELLEGYLNDELKFEKMNKQNKIDSRNLYRVIFEPLTFFLNPSLESSHYFIKKNFYKKNIEFDFKKYMKNEKEENVENFSIKSDSYMIGNLNKNIFKTNNMSLRLTIRKYLLGKKFSIFYFKNNFIVNIENDFFFFDKTIAKYSEIIENQEEVNKNRMYLYFILNLFEEKIKKEKKIDFEYFVKKNNLIIIGKINVHQKEIIFEDIVQVSENYDCLAPFLCEKVFEFFSLNCNKIETMIKINNSEDLIKNLKKIYYTTKTGENKKEIFFSIFIKEKLQLDPNSEKVISKICITSLDMLIKKKMMKNLSQISKLLTINKNLPVYSFIHKFFEEISFFYNLEIQPLKFLSYYELIFFESVMKIKNSNEENFSIEKIIQMTEKNMVSQIESAKQNLVKHKISAAISMMYKNEKPDFSYKKENLYFSEKNKLFERKHVKIFLCISLIRMGKSFFLKQLAEFFNKSNNNFISFYLSSDQNKHFRMEAKKFEYEDKKINYDRDLIYKQSSKSNKNFTNELKLLFRKILNLKKSKFAILLDKNFLPNEYTLGFIKGLEISLQKLGLSFEFIILHINSPEKINNLQIKEKKITFYFSMKMVLDLFLRLKNNTQNHLTLSNDLNKNFEILLDFFISFFNYDETKFFEELKFTHHLFFDFFNLQNKELNLVCLKFLTLPFFNVLFAWSNLRKNKESQKQEQLQNLFFSQRDLFFKTINNFLLKFSEKLEILQNYLPNEKMFSDFVVDKKNILNSKNFYRPFQNYNYKEILYFGVFFSLKFLDITNAKLDEIIQKKTEIPDNYRFQLKTIELIRKKEINTKIRYPPNYHMTVCFLNGRNPIDFESEIINSYFYKEIYQVRSRLLVMVEDKIGFVMMNLDESVKSCNKYKHTTIYFSGKYLAQHSNNLAELVQIEINLGNFVYFKNGFKIVIVKDIFDSSLCNHAFIWDFKEIFEGNFDYEKIQ